MSSTSPFPHNPTMKEMSPPVSPQSNDHVSEPQLRDVNISARLAECDKKLEMLADILLEESVHVPHEVLWDSYAWDWAERENKRLDCKLQDLASQLDVATAEQTTLTDTAEVSRQSVSKFENLMKEAKAEQAAMAEEKSTLIQRLQACVVEKTQNDKIIAELEAENYRLRMQ